MIKIMIVDDMPVFREYLRDFIDWETYGFAVCCEARDGREALALYEKHQPDIVLADIMMPHMDGLELSQALLQENPALSIVLITGNSEFEYARRAVKLGVCDYIVKPFEKEELIITLLKLQDNINKVLEMKNEQEELLRSRREQDLRHCIYARGEGAASAGRRLFEHSCFLLATLSVGLHENRVAPEEILQWKEVLSSLLLTMVQIDGVLETFHDFEGNIVTVMAFREASAMEAYDCEEFAAIARLAKERIGFEVSVGISDFCYGEEHLGDAYYQTIQALGHFYVPHNGPVFNYRQLAPANNVFYSWNLIDGINQALEVMDYERIEALILGEMDTIREYENAEYAVMIYMSLLSILLSYLARLGRSIDDIFGKRFRPYSALSKGGTYVEKRQFVCRCYRQAIDYLRLHQDTKSAQVAKEAKAYIKENYSNPGLVVDDISKQLLVNQTYLRRMFKDEYQTTISDYITKYRMEKARELLKKGGYTLAYVAQQTGYNDTGYFSKSFKKYFGYSPKNVVSTQ